MKLAEVKRLVESKRELEVENGLIKSVSLSNEDHGCLSAWLFIDFDGGGCGFGGYKLGNADGGNLDQKNYAAEFIVRCLNTVGVGKRHLANGMAKEIEALG